MTKNIKVAYLLSKFPQLTQTFVTREIFWIREHNVQTEIFSLFEPASFTTEQKAMALGETVHYSPKAPWAIIKALFYYLFRSPIRLLRAFGKVIWHAHLEPKLMLQALATFPKSVYFARIMEDQKIEHIHVHFVTLASFAASTISELLGISFTLHGHAVDLFSRSQTDVRRQLENASGVITISSYHKAYIDDLCPNINMDNVEIVYCGLEADQFTPVPKHWNNDRPFKILSIGRLIEKKGFEYLIDACAMLSDLDINFQCQIAGDGPLQDELQERINTHGLNDKVSLLGPVEQDKVLELYHQNDIFVLACVVARDGNRDGMPVVLIEAMSCELPVVTTPVTGIVDLVEHNVSGLLVDERDAIGLHEAINSLINDEQLREKIGRQGREKVLREFQVQQTTQKLSNKFREIIMAKS